MDDSVREAVKRNMKRILASRRGAVYRGREEDLEEGLRLMAEHELEDGGVPGAIRLLDECDPAAPGMMLMYL